MACAKILAIKDEIINKIVYGDFTILSSVISTEYQAARMRFYRNNPEAILLMRDIVTNREKLVKKLKNKHYEKSISN